MLVKFRILWQDLVFMSHLPPAAESEPARLALGVSPARFQWLQPNLSLEGIVLAGDSPNESFVFQSQLWQVGKWNHFQLSSAATQFNS